MLTVAVISSPISDRATLVAPPHSMLVAPARTQHTKQFVILILLCKMLVCISTLVSKVLTLLCRKL